MQRHLTHLLPKEATSLVETPCSIIVDEILLQLTIVLREFQDNLAESWINICNKFNGAKQHSRSPRGA